MSDETQQKIPSAEYLERERRRDVCEAACEGLSTAALEAGALAKALEMLDHGLTRLGLDCGFCHGGSTWSEAGVETYEGGITHEKDCELAKALRALGRLKP